jgi:glycosyltransferase involved in cell wall biosynthesis
MVTKSISSEMTKQNITHGLFPYGTTIEGNTEDETQTLKSIAHETRTSYDKDAPCLNIWHQHDLAKRIGSGHYMAYPFFELDRFTAVEKHNMMAPDTIISASKWAKWVVSKETGRDSVVINPGVDRTVFKEVGRHAPQPFTFFNIGKWEVRKGHDIIPRLFDKAFEKKDDVRLVMAPHNMFLTAGQTDTWVDMYRNMKLRDKVRILPRQESQYGVCNIINDGDCGLFPSRAEGWNMEALESLSCGKPIIITNYSAHRDYCTDKNSMLVEIEDTEPARDGKWFFGQGEWADIDHDEEEQIIEHMRAAYKEGPVRNVEGIKTAQNLSWAATVEKIQKIA